MAKRDEVAGLGAVLKGARTEAGLTMVEVEGTAGIKQSNLSQYETGAKTPTLAILYRLARAYGVSVCDLLPEDAHARLPIDEAAQSEVASPAVPAPTPAKRVRKAKGDAT